MIYKNFEIKNVKTSKALSEETEFFSLDFFMDGKKIAAVSNDGRGGCHRVHPLNGSTGDDIKKAEVEMSKDEFLVDSDFEKFDSAISVLLELHMTEKDIKKLTKTEVTFIDEGKLSAVGYKKSKIAPDEKLFEHVAKEYPNAIILNKMDIKEAAILTVKENAKRQREMFKTPENTSPSP